MDSVKSFWCGYSNRIRRSPVWTVHLQINTASIMILGSAIDRELISIVIFSDYNDENNNVMRVNN